MNITNHNDSKHQRLEIRVAALHFLGNGEEMFASVH